MPSDTADIAEPFCTSSVERSIFEAAEHARRYGDHETAVELLSILASLHGRS